MQKDQIEKIKSNQTDTGELRLQVQSASDGKPVKDAVIYISESSDPDNILKQIRTDSCGMSETVTLAAPPVEYSMMPEQKEKPYSEYDLRIEAEGHEDLIIRGVQIFPGETAIQPAQLRAVKQKRKADIIIIKPHTLYGKYPPKVAEGEIKTSQQNEAASLRKVIIPEFVVVHDGPARDKSTRDYYVRYKDYIKNVASCELYPTWPKAAVTANILAILSFTMNRVYTQWYRNKGFDFTITSSTAFDYKWMHGRNIYQSISRIVDELFDQYLSRPNVKQPVLLQCCDGERIHCPHWMAKWDAVALCRQDSAPIEILRHYYGETLYMNTAEGISGVPVSWPGHGMKTGSNGDAVVQVQKQMNAIAVYYPLIPEITVDGIYGSKTEQAVLAVQKIFGYHTTGTIDKNTWYKIQEIYVSSVRRENTGG